MNIPTHVCEVRMTPPERSAVVAEAKSWIGTGFLHQNCMKKTGTDRGGVDCARFVMACYAVVGVALDLDLPPSTRDWFLHTEDDRFISRVRLVTTEVERPESGDLALFKVGKSWAHAGIVVEWPNIIHAKWNSGVQYCDASQLEMARTPVSFWSPVIHSD